jgi:hypothetical protein
VGWQCDTHEDENPVTLGVFFVSPSKTMREQYFIQSTTVSLKTFTNVSLINHRVRNKPQKGILDASNKK